ncbi:MAG TPA: SPFH domain-containing protein [Polyangia bacterium]|jgi:Putative virion core protein (lumpy skin disease virus)|nr:SPFH domain-containing protein [Polyangia bacterium]
MGILSRQLRSVIQWEHPDPSQLFHRWSDHGDEIKNASRLVVGPGQGCIFVYEGRIEGIYAQEGLFEIRTANLPFFTTLSRLMQLFESEHKVGIYFFRTAKILNLKWGTSSLIKYEDPKYKFPVGLRAFGNYSMQITEPGTFFCQIVGGRDPFLVDDIREPLNARLVQPLVDFLAEAGYSYAQIDPNREEIAAALSVKLAPDFAQLGFRLEDFRIQGTSFDDDTMRRINRIADVNAEVQAASSAGLSYAQMQQLSALRDAAKNEGAAGMGMGMAVGMGMGGIGANQSPLVQPAQPPAEDPAAKLRTLKSLRDQGLISAAEYEEKKKEILAAL